MKRLLTTTAVLSVLACLLPGAASADSLTWRAHSVNTGTLVTPGPVTQLSCPTTSECFGVDSLGSVAWARNVGPSEATTWQLSGVLSPTVVFNSISCPSTKLCVAIDQAGGEGEAAHIAVSTHPTGSARDWSVTTDPKLNSLANVDCPTTHLCVIDGLSGLLVSTDPTGALTTWKPVLAGALDSNDGDLASWTSCPSASLCVTVGDSGGIYSSTRPAGGNAAWSRVASFPQILFSYVDCPSTSLCVALGFNGEIVTSTNPTAAHPTWVSDGTAPDLQSPTTGLSCPSAQLCVATDSSGDVAASTDPTGPAPASWTGTAAVDSNDLASVECPTDGLCLAPDGAGAIAQTSAPDSAQPNWTITRPAGLSLRSRQPFTAISCPSASLCAATVGGGHIASVRDPATSDHWSVVRADPGADLEAISCPSSRFCAAIGANDALSTTSDPTGPASAWKSVTLKLTWASSSDHGNDDFDAISCPSAHECIAPDTDSNDIASSAHPAGGAKAWNADYSGQYDYDEFFGVSCPSVRVCVSVGLEGDVWTQQNDGTPPQLIASGAALYSVSCPTVTFCAAIGTRSGYANRTQYVYVGSPTGDKDWTRSRIEFNPVDQLQDVACASANLCVAVDSGGKGFVSQDPAGGAGTWQAQLVDPGQSLYAVDCPTTTMCVAVGSDGSEVIGRT